jgi:hypothetical protein
MTDARQKYLGIVLPIVKDGHGRIAEAERALLNRQRDCLNLSPREAEAIEQRALNAYQLYLRRRSQNATRTSSGFAQPPGSQPVTSQTSTSQPSSFSDDWVADSRGDDRTLYSATTDSEYGSGYDPDYESRLHRYKQELARIMRSRQPIDAPLRKGLQGLQQIYHLRDDDVRQVEAELAMELRDVEEAHQAKCRWYEEEFARALAANQLTQEATQERLWQLQQDLQLDAAEVIQLERQVYARSVQPSASTSAASPDADLFATRLPDSSSSDELAPTELQDTRSPISPEHSATLPSYYTELRNALTQKDWGEADRATLDLMLKLTRRETEGWLDLAAIEQFPCRDLERIDQLWNEASQGKFSFSKQLEIYSTPIPPKARFLKFFGDDYERALSFSEQVGWWRSRAEFYKYYNQLIFGFEAPAGQFPALWFWAIPWWKALQFGGLGSSRGGCRVDPQTIAALMVQLQSCQTQQANPSTQSTQADATSRFNLPPKPAQPNEPAAEPTETTLPSVPSYEVDDFN